MLMRLAPALFVLLWSTGFLGTKIGAAHAEPFTLLVIRFGLVLSILVPSVLVWRWRVGLGPALTPRQRVHAMAVGALVHGGYIAGCAGAMGTGMPAGMIALITSLQPILTAVLAGPLLGERLDLRAWVGLALGLLGAGLIVWPKLALAQAVVGGVGDAGGLGAVVPAASVAAAVGALVAITIGTLYQKRFASNIGLLDGAVWQYVGAFGLALCGSFLFETQIVRWTLEFALALAWLVIVISLGAISLLMLLLREHAVSRVSGLFYLTPATTAVMAYGLFGERLSPPQLAGMAVAMIAVLLIANAPAAPVSEEEAANEAADRT